MVQTSAIDPEIAADIAKFERLLVEHLDGRVDEDAFRVFRLNNGIYGQRQGGHNQMVRIKFPYGSVNAEQLEALASISERYSRGWGHLTTRQNVQFHFVQLEQVPALLKELAAVGLTTREACGDTVRNVMGCHLAGCVSVRGPRHQPVGGGDVQALPPSPLRPEAPPQVQDQLLWLRDRLRTGDVQRRRRGRGGAPAFRRHAPARLPGFVAGGLGANPHPAHALEEFTSREELLPTIEAVLRTFDHFGNRYNKLRARLKWVVDESASTSCAGASLRERTLLLASSSWPGGIPDIVAELGDAPAGLGAGVEATPVGTPVTLRVRQDADPYTRWESTT